MSAPQTWIGRSREATDPMDPRAAEALCRTLDLARAAPVAGDPLPIFWHWMYHHDAVARAALGPDGHPAVGDFMPMVAQPRRMWAGGRVSLHRPLVLGQPATRVSTIADVVEKTGRAGEMTFVTVRHGISGPDGLAVSEEQDIVYRHDPKGPPRQPPMAPTGEVAAQDWCCDSTVLFRYSALTFNGHKIHYDLAHACDVEGYPGLVVHGPLLMTLLLELAPEATGFAFRAISPVFADETFTCCAGPVPTDPAKGRALWVRGQDGRLAMEATLT